MRRSSPLLLFCVALGAAAGPACSSGAPGDEARAGTGEPAPTPEPATSSPPDASVDAPTPEEPKPGSFAILSLNLHCLRTDGTAYATNEARFAAIADVVKQEGVVAIAAQEVCERPGTSTRALLAKALETATGVAWSSAASFTHPAWEGTPDAADEHVAIFARGAVAAPRETVHRAQGSLRRVTLAGGVALPSDVANAAGVTSIRLHTVHLDHADAAARAAQAREVASVAMVDASDEGLATPASASDPSVSLPVVVAGDFNAREATDAFRAMIDFGFVDAGGSAGTTRIDHAFAHRSAPLAAIEKKTLFTGGATVSDHPAVLVRFGAATPARVRLTRVVARGTYATPLTLRGDRAPLSWDRGWPAFAWKGDAQASVAVVTSEMDASPFAFKFLRGDDWQTGANATGTGQDAIVVTPAFP